MISPLSPSALVAPLTAAVQREALRATVHVEQDDGEYWCVSWRINHRADRELFVEYPGHGIAPSVVRIGVYFRDAADATATDGCQQMALEALASRRDALTALGATCTFTFGSTTRDDQTFAWHSSELERWLRAPSAHRDLVVRWDLHEGLPSMHQLERIVQTLAPIWRIWNAL